MSKTWRKPGDKKKTPANWDISFKLVFRPDVF
jgi:hypothetical protein